MSRLRLYALAVVFICLATTSGTSAQRGLPSVLDLLLGKATGQEAATPAVEAAPVSDGTTTVTTDTPVPQETAPSADSLVPATPEVDQTSTETPTADAAPIPEDPLAAAAAAAAAAANGGSAPTPPSQEISAPATELPAPETEVPAEGSVPSVEQPSPGSETPTPVTEMPTEPNVPITEPPTTQPEAPVTDLPTTEPNAPVTELPTTEPNAPVTELPTTEPNAPVAELPTAQPEAPVTELPTTQPEVPVTETPTTEPNAPVAETPTTQTETPITGLPTTGSETLAVIPSPEVPTASPEVPTATPPAESTPSQPDSPSLTPSTPAPTTNPEPAPEPEAPNTPTPEASTPPQDSSPAPGAPPSDWAGLKKDSALIFELELRGKYLVPWTSPKSYVVSKVLVDHYFKSAQLSDVTVDLLNSFTYLSYDLEVRRRTLLSGRSLLQQEMSGVSLKVAMTTNRARTDSEITSLMNGIMDETLAADITEAGVPVVNATVSDGPKVVGADQINPQPKVVTSTLQGWAIGLIVTAVLLVVPVPLYFLIRSHRRKRKEAIARQQAEQAVARARAQSRIVKPKSFTLSQGGGSIHNINVRTGHPSSHHRVGSVRSLYSQGSLPGIQRQGSMQSQGGQSTRSVRFSNGPAAPCSSYPVGLPQTSFSSQPSPRTALGTPGSARGGSYSQGAPRRQRSASPAPHEVVEIQAYLEDASLPSPRQ